MSDVDIKAIVYKDDLMTTHSYLKKLEGVFEVLERGTQRHWN